MEINRGAPHIGTSPIINHKKVFGGAADGQGGNDVLVVAQRKKPC